MLALFRLEVCQLYPFSLLFRLALIRERRRDVIGCVLSSAAKHVEQAWSVRSGRSRCFLSPAIVQARHGGAGRSVACATGCILVNDWETSVSILRGHTFLAKGSNCSTRGSWQMVTPMAMRDLLTFNRGLVNSWILAWTPPTMPVPWIELPRRF